MIESIKMKGMETIKSRIINKELINESAMKIALSEYISIKIKATNKGKISIHELEMKIVKTLNEMFCNGIGDGVYRLVSKMFNENCNVESAIDDYRMADLNLAFIYHLSRHIIRRRGITSPIYPEFEIRFYLSQSGIMNLCLSRCKLFN